MRALVIVALLAAASCGVDPDAFDYADVPPEMLAQVESAMIAVNADAGTAFRLELGGDSAVIFTSLDMDDLAAFYRPRDIYTVRTHLIGFHDLYADGLQPSHWQPFGVVARHEFGHAAGFPHVCDPSQYMHSEDAC